MASLGVSQAVVPEGADPDSLERLVRAGAPADPLLRAAALLTGDVGSFADRLRLSAQERERLLQLSTGPVPRPQDDEPALRRLLADEPAELLIGRCWLAGDGGSDWTDLRARLAAMPRPIFPLSGGDIVALGVPEGPRVGAVLRDVRNWWKAGGCVADVQACLAEARKRLG